MEVGRYTLDKVKLALRPALDASILEMAEDAADQVGAEDREVIISAVLGRFASWLTVSQTTRRPAREGQVPVPLISASVEERRRQVLLHTGIRFSGMLSRLEALDNGALAMQWQAGPHEEYKYEPPHPGRNQQIYLVRGSWALERGLIQPGSASYLDDMPAPGVEHYCQCHAQWLFGLRSLPDTYLTDFGRLELERVRREIAAMVRKSD